jgi:hypothetical protein
VTSYLTQAGLSTTGVTVTVANVTTPANTDPLTATQLDQFKITVTLPSNNVRWVLLNNLAGSATLTTSCLWNSMRDLPLTVPTTIPVN